MEEGLHQKYLKYKEMKKNGGERPIFKSNAGLGEGQVPKGTNVMGPSVSHNQSGINLVRFQETLNKLKDYSDMNVNSTPEDIKAKYQNIIQTMGLVNNTPTYDTLSKMISSSLHEKNPFPGTIGGTLTGCHTQFKGAEMVEPGCTPTCAGALKANNDSPTCPHKIYLSEPTGQGGFHLKNLFTPSPSSPSSPEGNEGTGGEKFKAYVYVARSKDKKFHKPNYDERSLQFFEKDGVSAIKFLGYDATNNVLVEVSEDFIPMETLYPKKATHKSLQQRKSENKIQRAIPKEGGGLDTWDRNTWIIIGIVILLVVGFVYFNR